MGLRRRYRLMWRGGAIKTISPAHLATLPPVRETSYHPPKFPRSHPSQRPPQLPNCRPNSRNCRKKMTASSKKSSSWRTIRRGRQKRGSSWRLSSNSSFSNNGSNISRHSTTNSSAGSLITSAKNALITRGRKITLRRRLNRSVLGRLKKCSGSLRRRGRRLNWRQIKIGTKWTNYLTKTENSRSKKWTMSRR